MFADLEPVQPGETVTLTGELGTPAALAPGLTFAMRTGFRSCRDPRRAA